MQIKIWKIPFGYWHKSLKLQFKIEEVGYIEAEEFDRDDCWHLCNWSCWTDDKPENLHSEIEVANSDVIFLNPQNNTYHLALPLGWKEFNSIEECINYCLAA